MTAGLTMNRIEGRGRSVSRSVRAVALIALLALGFGVMPAPSVSARMPSEYYVRDTGHVIAKPFLDVWAQLDGRNVIGMPVTEPVAIDNKPAQYFEYALLAAASQSARDPRIDRVETGAELLSATFDPDRTVAGRRIGGDRSGGAFEPRGKPSNEKIVFDAETGHSVSGRILGFYDRNGGAERFGSPLSESYVVGEMRVQWFEHGRLQWRLSDERVELGPVGWELAHAHGVATEAVQRGKLPLFKPDRYRPYFGDGSVPEARGAFTPVRIQIPAIAVDAVIEQVGIVEGVMGTPEDPWNVGWYHTISTPGDYTNVVAAGHRDWWGIGPTVFYDLEAVAPGDKIYLLAEDGTGSTYEVSKVWAIDGDANAGDVIRDGGREMLTLITCGGSFDGAEYESRWIVQAVRI